LAKKMKAAMLLGPRTIKFEERDIPKVAANEVLLRVKAVGVCGSDVAYYRRGKADVPPPMALGHEFTTEITELGEFAERLGLLHEGDRVVVEPVQSCGVCSPCKNAMPNLCVKMVVLGVNVDGGFGEYCKAFYNYVHPLPDNVTYEEGAFTEPLACAVYGVRKMRISPGDFCVVVGPGPIGLMMVQYVKASGAAKVLLVGTRDYRLKMGMKLGADYAINVREKGSEFYARDPVEKIFQLNDRKGADAVIVATGDREASQQALKIGGSRSRTVFFGGAGYSPEDSVSLNLWEGTLADKEIAFSWLSPFTFPAALKAISRGLVKVKPLVTHTFPLEKTGEAIETAEKRLGNAIKVQVKP